MIKSEELRTRISAELKRARIDAGLTVTEAAEALGKCKNTIYSWELGRILPTADVLLQVMILYGIKDFDVFTRHAERQGEFVAPMQIEYSRRELTQEQEEMLELMDNADDQGKSAARAVLSTFRRGDRNNVVSINHRNTV